MSKRNTQLRRHTIANLVTEKGEVSVDELSIKFGTSEVTIRKDLASLENKWSAPASLWWCDCFTKRGSE